MLHIVFANTTSSEAIPAQNIPSKGMRSSDNREIEGEREKERRRGRGREREGERVGEREGKTGRELSSGSESSNFGNPNS